MVDSLRAAICFVTFIVQHGETPSSPHPLNESSLEISNQASQGASMETQCMRSELRLQRLL